VFFGFFGGWISGALGLGGGAIFNPVLLSLGVPPKAATATSMYMILFSTFSSSFLYIFYRILNIRYALWLGFWGVLGTTAGIIILKKVMKKYKR
jgi:hypothetical protein